MPFSFTAQQKQTLLWFVIGLVLALLLESPGSALPAMLLFIAFLALILIVMSMVKKEIPLLQDQIPNFAVRLANGLQGPIGMAILSVTFRKLHNNYFNRSFYNPT